ncbi:MAG: hypothetical protein AB1861_09980 [Cyanobacteriota bacterium]
MTSIKARLTKLEEDVCCIKDSNIHREYALNGSRNIELPQKIKQEFLKLVPLGGWF